MAQSLVPPSPGGASSVRRPLICSAILHLFCQLYEAFVGDGYPALSLESAGLHTDQRYFSCNFFIGRFVDIQKVIWAEQRKMGDELYFRTLFVYFLEPQPTLFGLVFDMPRSIWSELSHENERLHDLPPLTHRL
jgi:hypothetical protein